MQKHTRNYFDFFNIDYDIPTGYHDYIDCEVCGSIGEELHHIVFKSQCGKDNVENIISLCCEDHRKAHSGELSIEHLKSIHDKHVFKHKNR